MTEALFYCRTCGMVRTSDCPPWCRHYALDQPATRMVPIPPSHPMSGADPEEWRERGRADAFGRLVGRLGT